MREEDGVRKYICDGQNKNKDRYSLEEFLWMVDHCRKLSTNAFHGYSFGIVFNKNIVCSELGNERMRSLNGMLAVGAAVDYGAVNANI